MKRLLFDLEGDGLLNEVTKVHCIAAADPDTGERMDWGPGQLPEALETLSQADELWAHFGLGYDFPVLAKVLGFHVPLVKQRDSVVLARSIYPNLRDTDHEAVVAGLLPSTLHGKHTLRAWGHRLGCPKADYEGPWDVWNEHMHSYMLQDVEALAVLLRHLWGKDYSPAAIELEHRIAHICHLMEREGWPFDEQGAGQLHGRLLGELSPIEAELRHEFGFWFVPKNKKRVLFDGGEVAQWFEPKRNDTKRGYVVGQPFSQVERVDFNPASRAHIIRCLKLWGWKPTEFTDNGSPRLDDEILEQLGETFPQGGALVKFLLLDKRIGQVATGDKAWLKQVGPDGKMHGTINPMGTSTSRASHNNPNISQVPANKAPYGVECRKLFTVPEGWKLIGADMQGFQLRALGHYLTPFDGGAYGRAVTQGDPHWRVVNLLGLTSEARDKDNELHEVMREAGAKRFMYATVFGCFDAMAGSIIRDCCTVARAKGYPELWDRYFGAGQTNKDVGKIVRPALYEGLGLSPLLAKLKAIRDDKSNPFPGSVPGLDGRWVPARSDHSALAALLQSAEGIICKRWIVTAYDELIECGYKWGWDAGNFVFCTWNHDELQCAVREGEEETVGNIIVSCAKRAGEPYGFRVPLASGYKVGRNWAETH